MKEKPKDDFSRLNQPILVTRVFKANGQVLEVSESGVLTEVSVATVTGREPGNA